MLVECAAVVAVLLRHYYRVGYCGGAVSLFGFTVLVTFITCVLVLLTLAWRAVAADTVAADPCDAQVRALEYRPRPADFLQTIAGKCVLTAYGCLLSVNRLRADFCLLRAVCCML